jgi:hypothetical protein
MSCGIGRVLANKRLQPTKARRLGTARQTISSVVPRLRG